MDTRFWGPSAWQLFHLIAFRSEHPDDVLNQMKDVLPCKYCRASTREYVKAHPLRGDPGRWLYDIHAMVNKKLRVQADTDRTVIDPGPDPEFEEVKQKYMTMKPTQVPGRDFLMSIAYNFPDAPEPTDMAMQRTFLHALADVYPFEQLRMVFRVYISETEPALTSRTTYTKWMYGLLKALSRAIRVPIRTYRGYIHHVAYYKSGCARKTYKGKTCRTMAGGGRTKDRNHRTTARIVSKHLLR